MYINNRGFHLIRQMLMKRKNVEAYHEVFYKFEYTHWRITRIDTLVTEKSNAENTQYSIATTNWKKDRSKCCVYEKAF